MSLDDYTTPKDAGHFLANRLKDGSLVLFLGAGTSCGAGLPDWVELLRRMANETKWTDEPIPDNASSDVLQRVADAIKERSFPTDEPGFADLVTKCLYDGVRLTSSLLQDELLIALGALMMGSRRGSANRVVTLNFDSVLEWYVTLCGYVPRIVTTVPSLEGAEDIRIYHPHGFLPHPSLGWKGSRFVVLGADDVYLRLGTPGHPWIELTRHLLQTGVGLFVGMSTRTFGDAALRPLLTAVASKIADHRPTGFWLLEGKETDADCKAMLRNNIVPVRLGDVKEYPRFILSICQSAAAGIASL